MPLVAKQHYRSRLTCWLIGGATGRFCMLRLFYCSRRAEWKWSRASNWHDLKANWRNFVYPRACSPRGACASATTLRERLLPKRSRSVAE